MIRTVILLFSLLLISVLHAQNVGIGTNSPSSSSILDISSTTKGMLMPRMNSSQRVAIPSPASGLLVFDTDTKTVWAYDGASWKNLYTSGGLVLPFSQTVNTAIAAFQVTNQGIGAATEGISINDFGIGASAKATGVFGWGLYAFSNRPGANSVYAVADSGAVFHGENNYTGNSNTLMSLLNRGIAKTATFQLSNNSSTAANVQVAGNNLAEQLLVFQTNAANTAAAVSISNAGTGAGVSSVANNGTGITGTSTSGIGIIGTSTSNYGVKGVTNTSTGFAGVYGQNTGTAGSGVVGTSDAVNTQGVYGSSVNGTGVRGLSINYRAIQGISTSGTGVFASSTSGLALETVGNIKISGGNTNPVAGAVLTSDASGNAVWKSNRVAFRVGSVHDTYREVPFNSDWKMMFETELYDYGNDFETFTGGTPSAGSSTFLTPVAGLYHFDVSLQLSGPLFSDLEFTAIYIHKQRGNVITEIAIADGAAIYNTSPFDDNAILRLSADTKLEAGDKIWISVRQNNDSGNPATMQTDLGSGTSQFFSGHLVVAD